MFQAAFRILGIVALIGVNQACKRPFHDRVNSGAVEGEEQAKIAQAKSDVARIVAAVTAYNKEYGKYPISLGLSDVFCTSDKAELMNVLGAIDAKPNVDHTLNPREIVFLEPSKINDPWGNPYIVGMDADYDGHLDPKQVGYIDLDAATLEIGVAAWSYGRDGKPGTNGDHKLGGSDDVVSWSALRIQSSQ